MIHQFKALGTNAKLDFEIDLVPDKQVYCFIGENGCGKTNLLENMAKVGLYFHSAVSKNEQSSKYKFHNFIKYFQDRHSQELSISNFFSVNKILDKSIEIFKN